MGGVDTMDLMTAPVTRPRQPLLTDVTVWRGTPGATHSHLDAVAGVWTAQDGWVLTRDFLDGVPATSPWAVFRPWILSPGAIQSPRDATFAVDVHHGDWVPEALFRGISEHRHPDQHALNGWDLLMFVDGAFPESAREVVTLPSFFDWSRSLRVALNGFVLLASDQFSHPAVAEWQATKGLQWARRLHLPSDDPVRFVEWLDAMLPPGSRPDRWPAPPPRLQSPATPFTCGLDDWSRFRESLDVASPSPGSRLGHPAPPARRRPKPMPLSHRLVDWLAVSGGQGLLERARVIEGLWDMCMLTLQVDAVIRQHNAAPSTPTPMPDGSARIRVRQALTLLVALYRLYHEAAYDANILLFHQTPVRKEV